MTGEGWIRFRSSKKAGVEFDLMGEPPRFLRIRDRSQDCHRGRAYIVIDLWARKVLREQTLYIPRSSGQKG